MLIFESWYDVYRPNHSFFEKNDHMECFFFVRIIPNQFIIENGMTVFLGNHSKLLLFEKWNAFLEKKAFQIEKNGEKECFVILRFRFFSRNL